MEHNEHKAHVSYKLPVMVARPADVTHLLRELDELDNTLVQLGLRSGGEKVELPKLSNLLEEMSDINKLNLLHEDDRKKLRKFLELVKDKAPVIHMSFSAEPNEAFIEKLMAWLRREIHPAALLTIGLQPNIGAGCIVRTTNKYFDFSLRQDFANKRDLLRSKLTPTKAEASS